MQSRLYKYCSECGAKNFVHAQYCTYCGMRFHEICQSAPPKSDEVSDLERRQAQAFTAGGYSASPNQAARQAKYSPAPAQMQSAAPTIITSDAVYASEFTGGAFANFFIGLLTLIVSLISLSLAYPAMKCWKLRWQSKHTCINGRRLTFDGTGIQLFGKYLLWLFLSIITFGIYFVARMKINIIKWQTKHTHIEGVTGGQSEFTGGALGLFGHTLLKWLVIIITLSFGRYWAKCHMQRWLANHTIYDGFAIQFDGRAAQYFGKRVCWVLLTIITFGIFSFWLIVKSKKWIVKHTVFAPGQQLPPVADKRFIAATGNYAAGATNIYSAPQSNGMAVAGFVLSLISCFGLSASGIIPILGVIFSAVGLGKSKSTNSHRGLAIAGLVLGILNMISFVGFIIAMVYYLIFV